MEPPFDRHFSEIADSMGIALYQRFTVNEASLFLRCSIEDVRRLQRQGRIDHIKVTGKKTEFFGYHLLHYLLSNTTSGQTKAVTPSDQSDRIIRAKEVQDMTGLSRTTLWRTENNGSFPRRVSLGIGSVGWRLSEVSGWVKNRSPI
jgi:predicted DNA-binding transcriptional regulator AlpA